MDNTNLSSQRGSAKARATPDVDGPDPSVATGKSPFGARKKFNKAVNLVKLAMKFDNTAEQENKSTVRQKPMALVKMENTYRMEPHDASKFNVSRSEKAIREAFEEHLEKYKYCKTTAPLIIQTLCTVIQDKVKKLGFTRYKFIVNVYMCSLESQCMEVGSRCLWDEKKDTFACANYKGGNYMAMGTVHAIYTE